MLPEKSFIRVNQQRDIRYRSTRLSSLCYLLRCLPTQRPGLAGRAAASKEAEHELNALTP